MLLSCHWIIFVPYFVAQLVIMFIYKVYIYLPCMKTQQWTTAQFDVTPVISSSNHQTTGLYQGSVNSCEGYRNFNIISLIHQYQTICYCNQSVLEIVPDLKIFVVSITIFDLISRSALVQFSLIRARNLYNSTTSIVSLWSPLSLMSALYWYNVNTILRFSQYYLILIILF